MKKVSIETTIPSLATARRSRDAIIAGHQAATLRFWEQERYKYDLYISPYVVDECADGDAAQRRLDFIKGIALLPDSENIVVLSHIYQHILDIPEKAKLDCCHLAVCVETNMDYLVSWNCKHLGIQTFVKVKEYNEKHGLWTPLLLTPEDLLELEEER